MVGINIITYNKSAICNTKEAGIELKLGKFSSQQTNFPSVFNKIKLLQLIKTD